MLATDVNGWIHLKCFAHDLLIEPKAGAECTRVQSSLSSRPPIWDVTAMVASYEVSY